MKKTIGIVGWKTGENSFGATTTYLQYLSQFGNILIITPEMTAEYIASMVNLVVMPGGKDLSPHLYGDTPGYYTTSNDLHKEAFMVNVLPQLVESRTPIFGVCLGFQMLAAHFNSKLCQHLYGHPDSNKRGEEGHKVYELVGNKKEFSLGRKEFGVNSHHHQGVYLNNLGSGLIPTYIWLNDRKDRNPENALVEAFIHPDYPVAAVQWHPEEWGDLYTSRILDELLNYEPSEPTAFQEIYYEKILR